MTTAAADDSDVDGGPGRPSSLMMLMGGVGLSGESLSESTVERNMTRRSGSRRTGDESLGGEGRLLQLESENAAMSAEIARLRERVSRFELKEQQQSSRRSLSFRGRASSITSSFGDLRGSETSSSSRRSSRRLLGGGKNKRRRHLLRDSILHTVEETRVSGPPSGPQQQHSSSSSSSQRGGHHHHQRSSFVSQPRVWRDKISRHASVGTAAVLRQLPRSSSTATPGGAARRALAERVIEVFREPLRSEHTQYLCSQRFADDLGTLASAVAARFETEPRVIRLESPVYVFGDLHGNLEDLHFFSDHIWKLGVPLVAGHLLFLGDYVDRGLSSLEVVAYLFALKVHQPAKVWLLRGNHETRDVNGWKDHYGDRSFLWQCEQRFGSEVGREAWEAVNAAFDRLPLAAVVDDEIFCVHGGIPRRPRDADPAASRLDLLDCVPRVVTVNPPDPRIDPDMQRMASECLWSDPALEDQEKSLDDDGYGESVRGGGTICFGNAAIQAFLDETGCAFVMRAHEAHAYGVSLSKMATVFTIFSTSKDHHQGKMAKAGCVLVDLEAIQVINRSPHYKNRFVHRRGSLSLQHLDNDEISRRAALGLVIPDDDDDDGHHHAYFFGEQAAEYLYDDDDDDDGAYEDDDDDDDDEYFQDQEEDDDEEDQHHHSFAASLGCGAIEASASSLASTDTTTNTRRRRRFEHPAARLVDANYSFMPDDADDPHRRP